MKPINPLNILQILIVSLAFFFASWVAGHVFFVPEAQVDLSTKNLVMEEKGVLLQSHADELPPIPPLVEEILPELVMPKTITIVGGIDSGDSFDSSLRRCDISAKVRQEIISSFESHLDFRRLDSSDTYEITLEENGNLLGCFYEASPLEKYRLTITQKGPVVIKEAINLQKKTIRLSGSIDGSLFASFSKNGEKASLVYTFADIFSSKIDFNTETRVGDKFVVLVDKYFSGDKFVGYGKINLAQYIQTNGRQLNAYYYSSESINGNYFDEEGQEVGTSFLRSPVPMARVTSKFTYRRKHPVTGKVQPHLGVDLAAPTGTPILAASDGKVASIGRNKGNGRQIILSHYGGYVTYYGHLSRYKKGLKKGSTVHKKEVIGYVGSTGLSTGPHLDYRIKHNGVFKNPFSLQFSPKSTLKGVDLIAFKSSVIEPLDLVITMNLNDSDKHIIEVEDITLHPDDKLILL